MDSKVTFVVGNIVRATEDFICHQTNCTSNRALGLARTLFDAFPHANTYSTRDGSIQTVPGSIEIRENVINLNAQIYPGRISKSRDSPLDRRAYFETCLKRIRETVPEGSSFAFPHRIGCGLAGGDWPLYLAMLKSFAAHPKIGRVVIYSLE